MILKTRTSLWGLNYVSSCEANGAKRHLYIPALFIPQSSTAIAVKPMIIFLCVLLFKVKGWNGTVCNLGSPGASNRDIKRSSLARARTSKSSSLTLISWREQWLRQTRRLYTLYLEKYENINQGPLRAEPAAVTRFFHSSWKCLLLFTSNCEVRKRKRGWGANKS